MRRPMLAGNWKMNKTRDEALSFMDYVVDKLPTNIDTVICAPAIILRDLVEKQGEYLRIGAENMHELDKGAYTGEISAPMLKSVGVKYVILGHSERRAYYNETNKAICAKVKQAFRYNLRPIICVGELLSEKEAGKTNEVLENQVSMALDGVIIDDPSKLVISYEPVWAIGTGKSASTTEAESGCAHIRSVLEKIYDQDLANQIRILYGGSVKTSSVDSLFSCPNIDGFLVGSAALNEEDFVSLCNACAKQEVENTN